MSKRRNGLPVCSWLGGLALVSFCVLCFSAVAQTVSGITSVIDGDTLEIHGERIRLHAIDAPEGRQSCYRDGQPWQCGQQAALALADLIGRKPVTCEGRERDQYGRLIAVCRLDGFDLNDWMVRQGWAMAYRRYGRDYGNAEREARSQKTGIWAGDFVPPWGWRRGERLGQSAPTVTRGRANEPDRDCSDFAAWEQAQALFERAGPGDPHRLDRDGDGIACESLR